MPRRRRRRSARGPRLAGLLALALVIGLVVLAHALGLLGGEDKTSHATVYDRDAWPHWIDEDGDCQDTRQEVLAGESLANVRWKDDARCKVASGKWRCAYTGRIVTDPRELDVDHLVPLHAAHVAGGGTWTRSRRQAFANALDDPEHLIAVSASANRQKGDRGPDRWLPPDPAARCDYVRAWQRVKARWDLALAPDEQTAIATTLAACARGGVPELPTGQDALP